MPGKFERCPDEKIGEQLYAMTLDGHCDDECGSVDELGWYGLLGYTGIEGAEHVVVKESTDGFFSYEAFDTDVEAEGVFSEVHYDLLRGEEE